MKNNFEPEDEEMSVRMEIEPMTGDGMGLSEHEAAGKDLSAFQLECLVRNSDNRNLVAPLREVHAALGENEKAEWATEDKRRAALALQEQWDRWLEQREQLRNEIKRGRECLEQVQKDLTLLRARLEEWPTYERICGRNPLPESMQSLLATERIEQFLPGWLRRREDQLQALIWKMEQSAKEDGVEHLL